MLYIHFKEMMDSSTFKRFASSVDNILESLEDVDLAATGGYEAQQVLKLPGICWNVVLRNVLFTLKQMMMMMKYLKSSYLENSS